MSRSLWLLSFTDLAALLLAFFALLVSTRRFEPAPPSGTVPVAPVPVAGLPSRAGNASPAGSFPYRAALARDGLAHLPPSCRPARITLVVDRMRAEWDAHRLAELRSCAGAMAAVLAPLATAPAISTVLILEDAGVDPARAPWAALRDLAIGLAPDPQRLPKLLLRRDGGGSLALVIEEERP
ncbi:hypothetical protein HRbin39_00703 [bacterium HR39]|nr:hypothetical protein HRbin39_00703 [bacterium HR39]